MRIAIPSDAPGGIQAAVSDHFGHCAAFTVVEVDGTGLAALTVIQNPDHQSGDCLAPLRLLQDAKADVLVVSGIGRRPLMAVERAGIDVGSSAGAQTVADVVELVRRGRMRRLDPGNICGGSGHCHSHCD
jgi:predicted Fe-Mo cluster-binding NifX family protein